MTPVPIKNGIIVPLPPTSQHDVTMPDGRIVTVVHANAVAIFTGGSSNRIGPAAVGYGLTPLEAWQNAVNEVKKQLP